VYIKRADLDAHVRELLSKATAARRAWQIFIPSATAIIFAFKTWTPQTAPKEIATGSVWIQSTLLVLVAFAGMVVVLTEKSATSVVHDAQKALDGREDAEKALSESKLVIEELEGALARSARVEHIVDAMRAVVDVAICQQEISDEKLTEWLTDLLDFLVTDKLTLFGIGDEQWNFSVYLFDPATSELSCVVTRRPTKKEEEAPHRSWREGEGHVGKAFQGRRPLVCADSADANVRGFFDAPAGKLMDYDLDRYRSLAALPIQSDDEPPFGVLVATSDIVGRFDPEDEETFRPLLSLSRTLATLLSVYNVKHR
jgi:hypothetical protein